MDDVDLVVLIGELYDETNLGMFFAAFGRQPPRRCESECWFIN